MDYLVAIAVGLFVAILFLAIFAAKKQSDADRRIATLIKYSPRAEKAMQAKFSNQSVPARLIKLNILISRARWAKGFITRADNAGLLITPLQWIAYIAATIIVLTLFFQLLFQFLPLSIIAGIAIALASSRTLIVSRETNRRLLFEQQLPEFLLLIASSLRSGLSLTQSLESVSQQGEGEVERQIRRATSEIALGMSPNDALTEVAVRMKSEDMRWVVVAIAIQREVGGNLSVILDSVAETVRNRASIKREVSTLSAESRLSAWILLALPVAVFAFFYVTRRDYISIFWTTIPGLGLLVVFVALITIGGFWMRSVVRIKV